MAEGLRFELRKELPLCRFSRPVHSTTLPSFREDCFIIKIISKPKYTLCDQKIPLTEALGKFYQFRNNPHTLCKLSFWGRPAYEILKYSKKNDYLLVEGYLSLRQSTFEKVD